MGSGTKTKITAGREATRETSSVGNEKGRKEERKKGRNAGSGKTFSSTKEGKREYEIRFLTTDELERLRSMPKPARDQIIIELLYATGCTVNELVNMRIEDFSFETREVRIGAETSRNHEGRRAVLPSSLVDMIQDYLNSIHPGKERSGYLLASRQSEKMTTKRVRQIVQNYAALAGVREKSNPQILRYTHIVHAFRKGVPIPAIQKQVGIKRSRAIQIFNQLKAEVRDDAYRAFWD